MALCELKYFSKALHKATAATILLPEGEHASPYSVLYLLHGLSDDNSIWQRRTSIERYVQNLPLMVVMPDGARSFYTDAIDGMAYETAIVQDLVGYIDRTFQTKSERAGRSVAGLSMGGYGAVKLALRFPELFCAAASHSGAMGFSHWPLNKDEPWGKEMARIVGEAPAGGPNDLYSLAEKIAPAERPALRIDCGIDDFLIRDNRAFVGFLNELGYDHVYAEYPGEHNWAYWDLHIQDSLAFLAGQLGLDARRQ